MVFVTLREVRRIAEENELDVDTFEEFVKQRYDKKTLDHRHILATEPQVIENVAGWVKTWEDFKNRSEE